MSDFLTSLSFPLKKILDRMVGMITSLANTSKSIISTAEIKKLLEETLANYLNKRIELSMLIDIIVEIEQYHKEALNPTLNKVIISLRPTTIQNIYSRERISALLKELLSTRR